MDLSIVRQRFIDKLNPPKYSTWNVYLYVPLNDYCDLTTTEINKLFTYLQHKHYIDYRYKYHLAMSSTSSILKKFPKEYEDRLFKLLSNNLSLSFYNKVLKIQFLIELPYNLDKTEIKNWICGFQKFKHAYTIVSEAYNMNPSDEADIAHLNLVSKHDKVMKFFDNLIINERLVITKFAL